MRVRLSGFVLSTVLLGTLAVSAAERKEQIDKLRQILQAMLKKQQDLHAKTVAMKDGDKNADKNADKADEKDPKRVLVFSLIHGDEFPSGAVARSWTRVR